MAYAAEGARLALTARTASELEDTPLLVTQRFGNDVITAVADVSDRCPLDRAVARTLAHYGAIDCPCQQRRQHRAGGPRLG